MIYQFYVLGFAKYITSEAIRFFWQSLLYNIVQHLCMIYHVNMVKLCLKLWRLG